MNHETVIVISIAVALASVLGIKVWASSVLKFKMDESAILNFLGESAGGKQAVSTEEICAGTDIAVMRVREVCARCKAIVSAADGNSESWHLK